MAVIGVALVLALFMLPSALNLPQSNPSQLAEYAPVPGSAQNGRDQGGNFAGLGLGSGSAAGGAGPAGLAELPPPFQVPSGVRLPTTKDCVGNPPRQTEDPLSPPCVGAFTGDNGGATYPGVTAREIRLLVYIGGGGQAINQEQVPNSMYVDLAQPPSSGQTESTFETYYRNWQTYFNARYQTYGRRAHFWIYFSGQDSNGNDTPDIQRADAADNLAKIHPFAVIAARPGTDLQPYFDAMAQAGVLNFGGLAVQRALANYRNHPGLQWGFQPPVEYVADMFADWVCTNIKPNPVSFSGNVGENGSRRVYGFLELTDPTQVNYQVMQREAKARLQACGITFKDDLGYPDYATQLSHNASQVAATNMATLKRDGVTTILWAGDYSWNEVNAAQSIGYFPEWVNGGDWSDFEDNSQAETLPPQEWAHAWLVSPVTLWNEGGYGLEPPCYEAYTSVDPQVSRQTYDLDLACEGYDALRMLFTGIQVAGPRLRPASMDQGFHAIPPHSSTDPNEPACFYNPGDYTCEKDAVVEWWDPNAKTEGNTSSPTSVSAGCWRMIGNGQRYLPGRWPTGDPTLQQHANDICNLYQKWT